MYKIVNIEKENKHVMPNDSQSRSQNPIPTKVSAPALAPARKAWLRTASAPQHCTVCTSQHYLRLRYVFIYTVKNENV